MPIPQRPIASTTAPRVATGLRITGALALAIVCSGALHAQSGGAFAITRSTVDSGAGAAAAAPYGVRWMAGQPDAGFASGAAFTVRGGFWGSRSNPPTDSIFAHGFE